MRGKGWRWFRFGQRVEELPIEFELDLNKDGQHVVSLFEKRDGKRRRLEDVSQLWDYGATVTRGDRVFRLPFHAVETLQALRSLNPQVKNDGTLVFDVFPPILDYLRKKSIKETKLSRRLEISTKPLEPKIKVDYVPSTGLRVEAGYVRSDEDTLIPESDLELTPDRKYARFGDTFFPLKSVDSDEVRKWLKEVNRTIKLDDIPEFFKRDLVLLRTNLSAVLTDQARKVQIVAESFKPRVEVRRDEPGWLDFVVDYQVGDYILSQREIEEAQEYIHPDAYTWVQVDRETINDTERQLEKLGVLPLAEGFRLPITQFSSLEEFIDLIGGERVLSKEYEGFLEQISGFKPDPEFKLSDSVERLLKNNGMDLRSYQRAGIHWLNWLTENYLHGILADDMGLGKTVQTISAINLAYETQETDRPSLIVCPKSVVPFWVREIHRCTPKIRAYQYLGTNRDKSIWSRAGKDWFITTYETLVRDIDVISRTPFFFLVLDEASKIKNPNAQRTQAIKSINALHRLALTGTPIENRLDELWSILDFLIKGLLGTQSQFINRYGTISAGDSQKAEELSKRIRPFLLRRVKKDVAKDLPEKIELEDWCDLTEEQRSLYGQIQDQYAEPLRAEIERGEKVNYQFNILPILTKLKQVCDHPALVIEKCDPLIGRSEKFDVTLERINEIKDAGERVVVFSHFLKSLDLFEKAFSERGISSIRIDGSTRNRQKLIDQFNGGGVDVALCSIRACGYGITLTAANHVIHFDRWWNPAVEDQATDRVHRIGQSKTVYVYRTLVSRTLEEKIAMLLERKRNLADRVVGAALDQPMQWTREELLELLKPLD